MARYAKALVGAAAAAAGALVTALTDGTVTPAEWTTVAVVFLGTLAGVYRVPNAGAPPIWPDPRLKVKIPPQ